MKKMARIIVAAVLVVAMMTANVFAAGGPQIVVNDATAADGKAEVTIDIKDNTGFAGYQFEVEYGDELTLVDYENGKFTGGMIDVNVEENLVGFMAVSNQTGDGTLVKLIFEVADGEYMQDKKVDVKVTIIELFDEDTEDIKATVDNGVVTIPSNHECEAAGDWQNDADNHWKECACGEKMEVAKHAGEWEVVKEATTTETGLKVKNCDVCGYEMDTEEIPMIHEHKGEGDWQKDDTDHWKMCECGEIVEKAAHTPSDWIVKEEATPEKPGLKIKECEVCGAVVDEEEIKWVCKEHQTGDWQNDADNHWKECGVCGEDVDKAAHTPSDWIVKEEATPQKDGLKYKECTVCKAVVAEEAIEWECETCQPGDWMSDDKNHWKECGVCGDVLDKAAHEVEWTVVKEATETEEGLKTGICSVCQKECEEVIPMITPEKPEAGADSDKDADKDVNKDADEDTSDNFNVLLFGMVAMAALAAACGTLFVRRRNEK